MYWNINKTLTYDSLFNFIIGNRGGGKTFGAKKKAIDRFLKTKEQFVYVRRFKTELRKIKEFFNDICGFYPEHTFDVKDEKFIIDGETAGFYMPLSTAKVNKSVPYPNVWLIIFDEFIIEKGVYHYLPNEVTCFLELYSTIARLRDVKVFFLANAITMTNPYFLYFDICLPYGKDIMKKGDTLIEMVQDKEYINVANQTRFGKLVQGTEYGQYAIENKFILDNNTFVEKKTSNSNYTFAIIYKGHKFGIWTDLKEGKQYVSEDLDPSNKLEYALTLDDHTPNTLLLKGYKTSLVNSFLRSYKLGLVRFESVKIKNICADLLKLTL